MTAQAAARNVTGTGSVSAGPCTFRGLSIRDDSAAGNTVTLYDNPSAASGTVIAVLELASGAAETIAVPDGLTCAAGLYLAADGAVVGSVWIG